MGHSCKKKLVPSTPRTPEARYLWVLQGLKPRPWLCYYGPCGISLPLSPSNRTFQPSKDTSAAVLSLTAQSQIFSGREGSLWLLFSSAVPGGRREGEIENINCTIKIGVETMGVNSSCFFMLPAFKGNPPGTFYFFLYLPLSPSAPAAWVVFLILKNDELTPSDPQVGALSDVSTWRGLVRAG